MALGRDGNVAGKGRARVALRGKGKAGVERGLLQERAWSWRRQCPQEEGAVQGEKEGSHR